MFQAKVVGGGEREREEEEEFIFFPSKNRAIYELMWKNMVVRKVTHDNTVLHQKGMLCMLDN
jgi:hypothetical protein